MTSPSERPAGQSPGDSLTSIHIRQAILNDRASVAWLVSRFTPLLLCQAQSRIAPALRAVCDADDAVSDVWMTVLGALPALEPSDGSFSRGLLKFASTVLIRRVRDLLEKHVLNRPRLSPLAGEGAIPDETWGVVSHVVSEERKGIVWAALNGLSDQDRDIMVLRAIEGRSHKDVASRVGLTAENVAVRYHRILKRLREAMPESVFDDLDDGTAEP